MSIRSCVDPQGQFIFGIHKPTFKTDNFREKEYIQLLGTLEDGSPLDNRVNFPDGAVEENQADWIYEIPNPFPFRGTTFIARSWADANAKDPLSIRLPMPEETSLAQTIRKWPGFESADNGKIHELVKTLPSTLLMALASTSTDPEDLVILAKTCCKFVYETGDIYPSGLVYKQDQRGRIRAQISNRELFETLANNIHLPHIYKEVMVLRPGVQGGSEIIGECQKKDQKGHVFEYLRRNSYIPWGHYAANMANDSVRYSVKDLTIQDMEGMRHLYYQRTITRLAVQLKITIPNEKEILSMATLEQLRENILNKLEKEDQELEFNASLWGWNYGFDFAPSGYRLHASHQQIHQQFAMIPSDVEGNCEKSIPSFACGDLVSSFIKEFKEKTGHSFFQAYIDATRNNTRMDKKSAPASLIVHEDENIILFVPKAQTSQWELQMVTANPVGNILEADTETRRSLDRGMLIAAQTLGQLGARMITTFEFSKRFDSKDRDHHLLYSFLPKIPKSPGAFSEAQLRWINGHFPEDFAAACRNQTSGSLQFM